MINPHQLDIFLDSMKEERKRVTEELKTLPGNNLYYQKINGKKTFLKSATPKTHEARPKGGPITKQSIEKYPDLIDQLVRKEYLETKGAIIDYNIKKVTPIISGIKPMDFNSVISSLPERCRAIPISRFRSAMNLNHTVPKPSRDEGLEPAPLNLIFDGASVEEWGGLPYLENTSYPENKTQKGPHGLLFRSKSEILISSIYERNGIPYHYDEVFAFGNEWISPDFVFVNLNGEFIYHEHWGMTGEDYLDSNLKKLKLYAEAGIYPGKNLLITADNDGKIDLVAIEDMIRYYFSGSFAQGNNN